MLLWTKPKPLALTQEGWKKNQIFVLHAESEKFSHEISIIELKEATIYKDIHILCDDCLQFPTCNSRFSIFAGKVDWRVKREWKVIFHQIFHLDNFEMRFRRWKSKSNYIDHFPTFEILRYKCTHTTFIMDVSERLRECASNCCVRVRGFSVLSFLGARCSKFSQTLSQ